MTRRTPFRPRLRNEDGNSCQKASLSLSPMSQPSTSRVPCSVTPVATTTAIDADRPSSLRTFRYAASKYTYENSV